MWPDRCGLDKVLSGRQPGTTLNLHRKLAISQLGSQSAIMKFAELQDVTSGRFLERLLVGSGAELDSDIKRQVMGHCYISLIHDHRPQNYRLTPLIV